MSLYLYDSGLKVAGLFVFGLGFVIKLVRPFLVLQSSR